MRRAYPGARVEIGEAPHGYRVLVVSDEFLAMCPSDREADFDRRVGPSCRWRVALTFLSTADEEWSGEWPFTNRRRFFDPKAPWHGAA